MKLGSLLLVLSLCVCPCLAQQGSGPAGNIPQTTYTTLPSTGSFTTGTTDPTGTACTGNQIYVRTTNGALYTCNNGVFAIVSGGSSITLQTNGTNNGSQSTLNLTGGSNVTVTDNGSGTDTIALTGLSPAPNTIAAVAGQKLDSYNQGTGNFTQSRYAIAAPIFSTTDTLTDTVGTEQLFATNMQIPANTLITNIAYKFFVQLEFTGSTSGNTIFQIYLCPTQGSLTGCKDIYKSTNTTTPNGTFTSGMEFGVIGTAAAGATATVIGLSGGGVGANYPIGKSTVADVQGNVPTNGNLFVQFSVIYTTVGTGLNTLSVRALIPEPGPIL